MSPRFSCVALTLFALLGCSRAADKKPEPKAPIPPPFWTNAAAEGARWQVAPSPLAADQAHRWWLDKTVRLLRGGEGLRPGENIDELLALPKEQVVDRLSREPRFANMALDFNIYFLGYKQDAIRSNGEFSQRVYNFPSAIESAREVLANGDYLRLLDLAMPAYVSPARIFREEEEKGIPELELYRKKTAAIQASLQLVIDYALKDSSATVPLTCDKFREHFKDGVPFIFLGIPFNVVITALTAERDWYFRALGPCFGGLPITVEALGETLEDIHAMNTRFFQQFEPFYDASYKPATVGEMRAIDVKAIGFAQPWMSWGYSQRSTLSPIPPPTGTASGAPTC